MNIKQAETATGISKQNIRFYETQGLLHPARGAQNDYRDYTQDDVRTLKRIKILRKLGIAVPTVREILAGEVTLPSAIAAQQAALAQQRAELDAILRVCTDLQRESLDTLDEDACLARIDHEEQEGNFFMKIIDDFKAVAKEEERTFTFSPDTFIYTAREFTEELLRYAKNHGQDITVTKESLYPEFTLDGVEYTAVRVFSPFGAVVQCTPMAAQAECAADTPRRKALRWTYRILPLFLIFGLPFWLIGDSSNFGLSLLLATIMTAFSACLGYFYFYNRK